MLTRLKFLTAGESHGQDLLGILDGMPAGLEISEDYIGVQLARRQMGHGRGGRMKIEKDHADIWCGVRHGETLGAPVGSTVPRVCAAAAFAECRNYLDAPQPECDYPAPQDS